MLCEYHSRFVALQLLVVVLLCPPLIHAQVSERDACVPRTARSQLAGMFDLEAARRYEKLSRWKEAEQEYLEAGRIGAPCVKKEALAAIERLNIYRSADYENFDFELGKMYEDNHEWKDAEQHYAAAAKDAPKPVRDRILLDVKRVRGHLLVEEFSDDFTRWLGYVATVLGLAFVVVVVRRLMKIRHAIKVMPFEGSTEDAGRRIVFSLSSAREQLPSLLAPVLETMSPNVVDAVPLIILPGVDNAFRHPVEDLEISGVKLPLSNWIQLMDSPLVRVYGRWDVGQTSGTAQARIQRRRALTTYRDSRFVRSTIDSVATDARDQQLALFAYDVLVQAIYVRRYGS
jgi:hypothetical protein